MNSAFRNTASVFALVMLVLVSLYTIGDATSNSATFGRYYNWLLFFNAVGLVALLALIVFNVYKLVVQYRLKAIGSRLTARMIGVFVLLTIIPVSVVYYFSLSFLHRGIDSWFDVGIETALEDSLQLGRGAIDLRKRDALAKSRRIADEIGEVDSEIIVVYLGGVREQFGANEITFYNHDNSIIASSSIDSTALPRALPLADIGDLDIERPYLNLVEDPEYGLAIQVVMLVQSLDITEPARTLQAQFPFTDRINELTIGVQDAYDRYKELAVLRDPLKTSFTMALSIIWLLSVLSAIWLAFLAARKLVSPINNLVEGTRAVAAGDYEKQLALSGNDELGFLLRSFNTMTRKIARSRAVAEQSQRMEARQRDYLESVLQQLTSGVLTIDADGLIKNSNAAACSILEIDSDAFLEHKVEEVVAEHDRLTPFFDAIQAHSQADGEWQEELVLTVEGGRKMLRVRGSALLGEEDRASEQVIVVDDLTELIQAQKESAWSEMARRLAHEIKNPLTPIQLSAERLQRKLGAEIDEDQRGLLDRYTHTIVQQVEAMKAMVNAFTDYARSPQPVSQRVDINAMLEDIAVLYHQDNSEVSVELNLDRDIPEVEVDIVRLRQLVHNLLKNSLETLDGPGWVRLSTARVQRAGRYWLEFSVEDSGPGIDATVAENLFEPYVTTKSSGSGLGLAIVQKIVDEHGGQVRVGEAEGGGAKFSVLLPLPDADAEAMAEASVNELKSGALR